jgi:outer membrane protein assembly factor BamB
VRGKIVLGIAVVAAVVVTVLVWPSGEDPAPPRATAPAPTLKPLRLAENPLWTGPHDISWAEERDGLMLIQHGNGGLSLHDATTGTSRWTFEKLHDLGGVRYSRTFDGGPDERHLIGEEGVLVQYDEVECRGNFCEPGPGDESGLALVSAADGRVVWRTPVVVFPDGPYESRPNPTLRVADDRVAVVSVMTGLVGPEYDKGTRLTVAIDVRTGAKLWERADGVWPMWIAGDTLLGIASPKPQYIGHTGDPAGVAVVATDLTTGEKRWERAESRLASVAGDVALIADGSTRLTAVTAGDGRQVGVVDHADRIVDCQSDRTALIACSTKVTSLNHDIVTFDAGRRKTGTATPGEKTVLSLKSVRAGRIFVNGADPRDATRERTYTMDSAGNEIDRRLDLPGDILLLTENRAVLATEDATAVYEILG